MNIRPLKAEDAERCDAIMRSLPDFFGYEPGLEDCARAVRTQAGYVAEVSGRVAGFATWEPRTTDTAEVSWMAVQREMRHGGIGTAIIEALIDDLRRRGFTLALAMTAARAKPPNEADQTYAPTRRFWFARGFRPLVELDIWETDIALLMVRPLAIKEG